MSLFDRVFNEAITYGPQSFSTRTRSFPGPNTSEDEPLEGLRKLKRQRRKGDRLPKSKNTSLTPPTKQNGYKAPKKNNVPLVPRSPEHHRLQPNSARLGRGILN